MTDIIVPIALVAALIALVWALSRMRKRGDYDERQELLRGKAYRYGFFTMLLVQFTVLILISAEAIDASLFALALALFAGLTVFAVYCIWNDAFFSIKQGPAWYLLVCLAVLVSNFAAVMPGIKGKESFASMLRGAQSINLLCAATFLIIGAVLCVKLLVSRSQTKED